MPSLSIGQPVSWTPASWRFGSCGGPSGLWSMPSVSRPPILFGSRESLEGATWLPIGLLPQGSGFTDMATVDFGQGLRAFGAGHFESIAGVPVVAFAEWDGNAWADPGLGFTSSSTQRTHVYAMVAHDPGSGQRLFMVGHFFNPGLVPNVASGAYRGIVEWDGVTLRPIGGMDAGVTSSADMVNFDPGGGSRLVVVGELNSVGGVPVSGAAMWDGATWSPLGIGIGPISGYPRVRAAAVFDEGQGPRLFVAGEFFMAGGLSAASIARWDGAAWSPVDGGLHSNFCPYVYDLAVYDDGGGAALYATGTFVQAGARPVGNIARWDGSNWDDLGGGFSVSTFAAGVNDDGDGEALFVSGGGSTVNGIPICGVSRYGPVRRPTLFVQQDAPGFPIYVQHAGLQQGSEYFNVFSADVCPTIVPGSGPLLGLCATDPQPLISQILLPVGAVPFHYLGGSAPSQTFGPYMIPPATFDFLSIEFRNGGLWSASHVARFTVQ
jgi:hypothetical protein